jgi:hypothetical protein
MALCFKIKTRAHPGSNWRPVDLQSTALPLSYAPIYKRHSVLASRMSYATSKINAAIAECERELAFLGGLPWQTAPRDTTYDDTKENKVVPDLIVEVGANNGCKYIQPGELKNYTDDQENPIDMDNLRWQLAAVYGLSNRPFTYVLLQTAVFPESGKTWKDTTTGNTLQVRYAMRSLLAYKHTEFEGFWCYKPPTQTTDTEKKIAALEGVLVLSPGIESTRHRANDRRASFHTFSQESVFNPTALSKLDPWRITSEDLQRERKRACTPSDSEQEPPPSDSEQEDLKDKRKRARTPSDSEQDSDGSSD